MFHGYSEFFKGYKCLSSTGRIYISRNVVFNEHEFSFHYGFLNSKSPSSHTLIHSPLSWHTTSNFPTHPVDSRCIDQHKVSHASSSSSRSSSPTLPRDLSPGFDVVHIVNDENIPSSIQGQAEDSEQHECFDNTQPQKHPIIIRGKSGIFKTKAPFTGIVEIGDNLNFTERICSSVFGWKQMGFQA